MSLLKEFESLVSQPDTINRLCETALTEWNTRFNLATFRQYLDTYSQIVQDTSSNERDKQLKPFYTYFKELRKAAQFLRTSFIILDKSHDVPEGFHTFTWALGQLKDRFGDPSSESFVAILQEVTGQSPNWGEFSLSPATVEESLVAATFYYNRVDKLIQRQQLLAPEFHQLRKKLRVFSHVYTLAVKSGMTGRAFEMFQILNRINDDLGDINDDLTVKSLAGEIAYEDELVPIDQPIQQQILKVLRGPN